MEHRAWGARGKRRGDTETRREITSLTLDAQNDFCDFNDFNGLNDLPFTARSALSTSKGLLLTVHC